jgi:short-subunit dehydrogenase
MKEKYLLLGASRGLGACFLNTVLSQSDNSEVSVVSRKATKSVKKQSEKSSVIYRDIDFSNTQGQQEALDWISEFRPTQIFYFAAGGPYGDYSQKKWKDHLWALEVSFLFPSLLTHFCLSQKHIRQLVLLGSAVAEERGDPGAASYAAAKHGLLGLHRSVTLEQPSLDFRLFSPGYMDTDLLPLHAWPRQKELVEAPQKVAEKLWSWSNKEAEFGAHLSYK